jgi:hypothetical protein
MIRIETTADVDTEGRLTLTAQFPQSVTPGPHRVTLVLDESVAAAPKPTPHIEDTDDPLLKRINGVLVWTGQLLEDPEAARRRLDDERADQLLHGTHP